MPTMHELHPERRTLHGHFSPDLDPVLTIAPGDTVRCSTLDARWGRAPYISEQGDVRPPVVERVKGLDDGHALIGPIAINGAQPGQTLEVHIKALRPGRWGFCLVGGGQTIFDEQYGVQHRKHHHIWELDAGMNVARNRTGHTVTLQPFMGVMGMPPPEPGTHPTAPPRKWGGNMDCKDLVAGSRLYLPVSVPGGLFSVGDGHGAQGHGEVSGTAIECPMDAVELAFHLHDDFPVTTPIAKTPNAWIAMGFDSDLNEATLIALDAMYALMERLYGLERHDVVALASVTVDLHITQIVNGVCGVHASLPHGCIR